VGAQLGDGLRVEDAVGDSDSETLCEGEGLTLGVRDPDRDGRVWLRLAVGGVRESVRVVGV